MEFTGIVDRAYLHVVTKTCGITKVPLILSGLKMSPGSKNTSAFTGSTKILLVLVLICSIFPICPSYTKRIGRNYTHDRVRRDGDGDGDYESASVDEKILDGTEPAKHEYRFIILLRQRIGGNPSKVIGCHGVLVAPHIIITAAHARCRYLKPDKVVALAGMHHVKESDLTMQTREVCHIEVHPKNKGEFENSYQIFYLSDPFILNDYVGTISLPFVNSINFQECMFCGWGYGEKVTIPLHRAMKIQTCLRPHPSVFCTVKGPCHDMGSPLVCAVGNLEFAAGMYAHSGCSSASVAYFSTFVTKEFRDWFIASEKKINQTCYPKH